MFKNILFAGLSFFIVTTAIAQAEIGKVSIDLLGGVTMPQGDFASTSVLNSNAGAAKPGSMFGLNCSYHLVEHFGAIANFSYGTNQVDTDPYVDQLKTLSTALVQLELLDKQINWTIDADPWKIVRAQTGLYASIPIGSAKRVAIEQHFMMGIVNVTSPKTIITGSYQFIPVSITVSEASTTAFSYSFGLSVRGWVTSRVSLFATADYSTATISYTKLKAEALTQTQELDKSADLSMLTLRAGLGFKIN